MEPFAARPVEFLGVVDHDGWRLKFYSIVHGQALLDRSDFGRGFRLVLHHLPQPPATAERAGVGFLIAHQGNGANYAVLCWWDHENELPIRVAVRRPEERGGWRPARGRESICVWDLEVIAFERQAYVETLLAGGEVDVAAAAYLERRFVAG
ncbi:MAG: hypothetical protein NDJ75_01705 [Thermoanaerobaculia bacterium]|nr:hypothetical protein [Thermoanaerobaculia bacterium]